MKIALYQMKMDDSTDINLQKSLDALAKAAEAGANLIVYPELQLSPFFPQYAGFDMRCKAVTRDSEIVKSFCAACNQHKIMAAPNVYLEENGAYYDATFLIDGNGIVLGCQKMVHIAQAEQFYEQDYYAPSNTGFQVFDTQYGKIGIVVCFDRHYPESIRTESLMGADLILIPTANTKSEPLEMFEWEIRVQAFQNSVAVAMCNRVGKEDKMEFAGQSIVADANGNKLLLANDAEQILYAGVDLKQSKIVRDSRPYTSLRRAQWYI